MKIAHFADSHLGYSAGRKTIDRVNIRERDGYVAFNEIIDSIIEQSPDIVVHGGDLFHTPKPSIRAIVEANAGLRKFVEAGIPVYIASGNHDSSDELGDLPATSAARANGVFVVDDGIESVEVDNGLRLYVASHRGVESVADEMVSDGDVNILLAHASVMEGATALHTEDAPREKVLQDEALDKSWNAVLLGHIHQRHTVKGRENVLYAGSALRRGFADTQGPRGWTMVHVSPGGLVSFEHHNIHQRAQEDLDVIHADGMSAAQITELIDSCLSGVDDLSITRVQVEGLSPMVRKEIDSRVIDVHRSRLLTLDVRFVTSRSVEKVEDMSIANAGSQSTFSAWAKGNDKLNSLPKVRREAIIESSENFIRKEREKM